MAKRRVRQPYVITKLHNGNIQTEIVWELWIDGFKPIWCKNTTRKW